MILYCSSGRLTTHMLQPMMASRSVCPLDLNLCRLFSVTAGPSGNSCQSVSIIQLVCLTFDLQIWCVRVSVRDLACLTFFNHPLTVGLKWGSKLTSNHQVWAKTKWNLYSVMKIVYLKSFILVLCVFFEEICQEMYQKMIQIYADLFQTGKSCIADLCLFFKLSQFLDKYAPK